MGQGKSVGPPQNGSGALNRSPVSESGSTFRRDGEHGCFAESFAKV